jgi:oligosaccharide repeat unit polymerase
VSVTEWVLALGSIGVAAAGTQFVDTHAGASLVAGILTAFSLGLVVLSLVDARRTGAPGKPILIAATLVYFWLGALDSGTKPFPYLNGENSYVGPFQWEPERVSFALLYVAVFQAMTLVGYSIRPRIRSLTSWATSRVDGHSGTSHLFMLALAVCAVIPVLLTYGFDLGAATESLLAPRASRGPAPNEIGLLHFLSFFGMFGVAYLLARSVVAAPPGRRILNFVAATLFVLPFVLTGTRHLLLFVIMPAVVIAAAQPQIRLNVRVTKAALLAGALLILVTAQSAARDRGWTLNTFARPTVANQFDVTGQFQAVLVATWLVPREHDYFFEPIEPYFAIHLIPRRIWPDKPIPDSWSFYNQSYTVGRGFNVTPSAIGQFHLNYGVAGVVLIGIWLGLMTNTIDRLLLSLNSRTQLAMATLLGMLYAFVTSSFRYYHPLYLAYPVFGLIGMYLVTRSKPRIRSPRSLAEHSTVSSEAGARRRALSR